MLVPGNDFPPTTGICAFLDGNAREIAEALIVAPSDGRFAASAHPRWATLGDVMADLPLHVGWSRALIPLRDGWVCYLDSSINGTDCATVIYGNARVFGRTGIRAANVSGPGRPTSVILEVTDAGSESHLRRLIWCVHDLRWEFETKGQPFDFEDIAAYRRRLVRDRFTPRMLEQYLIHLGVPSLTNENFDFESGILLRYRP